MIGVNKDQAQVRQRFTIAHELGHLKLHEHKQVHVDREFRVRFRSGATSRVLTGMRWKRIGLRPSC